MVVMRKISILLVVLAVAEGSVSYAPHYFGSGLLPAALPPAPIFPAAAPLAPVFPAAAPPAPVFPAAAPLLPVAPRFVRIVPPSVPPHAYSVNIVTRALAPPPPFLLPPFGVAPTQPLLPAAALNRWRR